MLFPAAASPVGASGPAAGRPEGVAAVARAKVFIWVSSLFRSRRRIVPNLKAQGCASSYMSPHPFVIQYHVGFHRVETRDAALPRLRANRPERPCAGFDLGPGLRFNRSGERNREKGRAPCGCRVAFERYTRRPPGGPGRSWSGGFLGRTEGVASSFTRPRRVRPCRQEPDAMPNTPAGGPAVHSTWKAAYIPDPQPLRHPYRFRPRQGRQAPSCATLAGR